MLANSRLKQHKNSVIGTIARLCNQKLFIQLGNCKWLHNRAAVLQPYGSKNNTILLIQQKMRVSNTGERLGNWKLGRCSSASVSLTISYKRTTAITGMMVTGAGFGLG